MRKSSLVLVLASGAALTIGAHAFAGPPPAGAPPVVTPQAPVSPAKGTVPAPPGLAWSAFTNVALEATTSAVNTWVRSASVDSGAATTSVCNNNNLVLGTQVLQNTTAARDAFMTSLRDGLARQGARPAVAQAVMRTVSIAFLGWIAGYSANIPNVFPELTGTTPKECHAPLASRQTTPFRLRQGSSNAEIPSWGAWLRTEILRDIGAAAAAEPGADAAVTAFANQYEWHFTRWRDAASISNLTCTATGARTSDPKAVKDGVKEGAPNCGGQVRGSNVLTGPTF
jgi:hypothetical protein